MKKKCSLCSKIKKLIKFHKHKHGKYGVQPVCKKCEQKRARTKLGKIKRIYTNQKRNSRHRKHPLPNYSATELIEWCMGQLVYHELYKIWKKSNYSKLKAPSCDRINDHKPYTLDNLQLITWEENNKKHHKDVRDGVDKRQCKAVMQLNRQTNAVINKYHSVCEAGRKTNIAFQNISACINGREKSAGGFFWKYANE